MGRVLLLSKISFYGTTLILIILILVLSFKFNNRTENKINEVSNEYIASYLDGEYQTEIPGKNDGYVVDKIVCDNGASATWDNEEWGINIRNATKKIKCSIYFVFKTEYVFDYTGTEQVFTVPKAGTYKIETWGAIGGNSVADGVMQSNGGYGGYSIGYIFLNTNDNIYINVGGKGQNGLINQNDILGGYNGGGISHWDKHDTEASGGGGGYYGGFGGTTDGVSGGGGYGYIGNSLLSNKAMYCYNCEESSEESTKTISTTCAEETPTENCAKKGNGYARITKTDRPKQSISFIILTYY